MAQPHYTNVDARTAWKDGVIAKYFTVPKLVAAALGDIGLAAAAFLWAHWTIGVLLVGFGAFVALWIYAIRFSRLRRIGADNRLHEFAHSLREQVHEICQCEDKALFSNLLDRFNSCAVEDIAEYFRARKGDPTINCAIRLGEKVGDKNQYVTRGRSRGMAAERREKSRPIPADEGLARALQLRDYQGVLLIDSVATAIEEKLWMQTPTDQLPDVKTLMVCPINSLENSGKVMTGILYLTSARVGDSVFCRADTLPMKAFADLLGLAYPIILGRMRRSMILLTEGN